MSFIMRAIKRSWRLLPTVLRDRVRKARAVVALRNAAARWRWRGKTHDEIYDDEYFAFVDRTSGQSAAFIARTIINAFGPASVIDVGCGTGALLRELQDRGVQVRGLERAHAALAYCRAHQLDVLEFDVLGNSDDPIDQADVVVSMEVGAQLPASAAGRYVDLLCSLGPVQVFSAEQLGGGDRLPLNEQPHRYWIEKFCSRGFVFDENRSLQWREQWRAERVAEWFCRNVLIFQRKD